MNLNSTDCLTLLSVTVIVHFQWCISWNDAAVWPPPGFTNEADSSSDSEKSNEKQGEQAAERGNNPSGSIQSNDHCGVSELGSRKGKSGGDPKSELKRLNASNMGGYFFQDTLGRDLSCSISQMHNTSVSNLSLACVCYICNLSSLKGEVFTQNLTTCSNDYAKFNMLKWISDDFLIFHKFNIMTYFIKTHFFVYQGTPKKTK